MLGMACDDARSIEPTSRSHDVHADRHVSSPIPHRPERLQQDFRKCKRLLACIAMVCFSLADGAFLSLQAVPRMQQHWPLPSGSAHTRRGVTNRIAPWAFSPGHAQMQMGQGSRMGELGRATLPLLSLRSMALRPASLAARAKAVPHGDEEQAAPKKLNKTTAYVPNSDAPATEAKAKKTRAKVGRPCWWCCSCTASAPHYSVTVWVFVLCRKLKQSVICRKRRQPLLVVE